MGWSWFVSTGAFAIAMSATPGPNNTMVAAAGANYGFRATLPHLLGICAGFPVMLLIIGSIGLPLVSNPVIHAGLKWIGVVYLLWLAWKIGSADSSPERMSNVGRTKGGAPLTFFQAALFQWVNPKAWIIAAGSIVAYTVAGTGQSALLSTAFLAIIFGVLAFPCVTFWTILGVGASRFLKTAMSVRIFNLAMAGLLMLSLVPSILER